MSNGVRKISRKLNFNGGKSGIYLISFFLPVKLLIQRTGYTHQRRVNKRGYTNKVTILISHSLALC